MPQAEALAFKRLYLSAEARAHAQSGLRSLVYGRCTVREIIAATCAAHILWGNRWRQPPGTPSLAFNSYKKISRKKESWATHEISYISKELHWLIHKVKQIFELHFQGKQDYDREISLYRMGGEGGGEVWDDKQTPIRSKNQTGFFGNKLWGVADRHNMPLWLLTSLSEIAYMPWQQIYDIIFSYE